MGLPAQADGDFTCLIFDCVFGPLLERCAPVILVLTAGFGDGHNTAASSTAGAVRRLHPGEEVVTCDLVSEALPAVAAVLKYLYQQAITHMPSAWRLVYRMLEKSDFDPDKQPWLLPLVRHLRDKIEALKPRVIISTYPVYAALLQVLRHQGVSPPPVVTIITDSVSIHRVWLMQPSDLYCVADEESRSVVIGMGVPADKIRVTGFPVSLQFIEPLPGEAEKRADNGRILYLPSTPARHVAATLRELRPLLENGARLTLPAGKHKQRLYHVLRRFTDAHPGVQLDIIGWTTRIPELLRTHDVVICKAGGAIMHEVLAARVPAVIDYVVPGQEEGNAEMLLSRRCGLRSHSPRETAKAVESILAEDCRLGREMSANMAPISVPDAAMRTARAALEAATPGLARDAG